MPLRDELTAPTEYLRLRRSAVFSGEGVAPGDGRPVLLLPAFMADDGSLAVLRGWLRRAGYRTHRTHLGPNAGGAEDTVRRLERRLAAVAEADGRRVALVGHSRGGHYARVLAVRRPDLVAGIVTLGAPPMDSRAVHPAVAGPVVALTLLGTLGVSGLMRSSCYRGECCARFRDELDGPFPPEVRFVAVYSRSDGMVDWRRLTEPAAERVEVPASHVGLIVNRHAYAAIAAALDSMQS